MVVVAQLVESQIVILVVAGSSPVDHPISTPSPVFRLLRALFADENQRIPGILEASPEVTGDSAFHEVIRKSDQL